MRHNHRSGLSRLTTYLQGRRLAVFGPVLVATGQAICQTGGWLLVRAAIDNGIGDSNSEYLTVVVVIYILVGAVGWVLSAILIRGLAGVGRGSCWGCAATCSSTSPRCRCGTSPSSARAGSSPA